MNATINAGQRRATFLKVLRDLRKDGIVIKQNVHGCCRSCICADPEKPLGLKADDKTTPYAWTYGGQGGAYTWDRDEVVDYNDLLKVRRSVYGSRRPRRVETIYFYHGNGAGERLAAALRAAGFDVEWDGSDMKSIEVKFATHAE